jgi:hypothetical protein
MASTLAILRLVERGSHFIFEVVSPDYAQRAQNDYPSAHSMH